MQTLKDKGKFLMSPADSDRSGVNETGTDQKIDTQLAQSESRSVRYELIGKDGRSYGEFWTAGAAAAYAADMWPFQRQDETRSGKGWDIEVI